ncbi:unnamed protein product [Protopolystoma xenopodis]|uniref:Helicase C-terminal domain-containing protein n=1 Tax=Protopolystoma xenopodis TaxID=117903 RepID=A0A448XFU6_9PLAT|nr:unnamed protein product [Protopolystoma xenopodis]
MLQEFYVRVSPQQRILFLVYLVRIRQMRRILCFANSREAVHRLTVLLARGFSGIGASELSGGMPVVKRQRVLQAFSRGDVQASPHLPPTQ